MCIVQNWLDFWLKLYIMNLKEIIVFFEYLDIDTILRWQKLGIMFENKMSENWSNKSCYLYNLLLNENHNLRKVQLILVIETCYFWEYCVICKFVQTDIVFLQNICIEEFLSFHWNTNSDAGRWKKLGVPVKVS